MGLYGLLAMYLVLPGQLDPLTPTLTLDAELRNPAGVTVTPSGTILVTDLANDQIVRFDGEGTLIGTWSVPLGPVDVGVSAGGSFYVVLRDEPAVGVFNHDPATDTFTRIGSLGAGDPMVNFVRPTDVDVATDTGRIYVADAGGDSVYGFASDGSLAVKFGARGELLAQFQYPSTVGVDEANDRLIIADQDNFRIQVFNTDGAYLLRFGYRNKYLQGGGEEGWMPRSAGLAVDGAGRIYLADIFMNTVRVFTPSGTELGKVLDYGPPPAGIRVPTALALNNDESRLCVVSTGTSSVEVYETPDFTSRVIRPGAAGADRTDEQPVRPGTNWNIYDRVYRAGKAWINAGTGTGLNFKTRPASGRAAVFSTGDDSSANGNRTTFDGPHMIQATIICGRCHGIDSPPGGLESSIEGQTVLCLSCHAGDGQAMVMPVLAAEGAAPFGANPSPLTGLGRSHPWGVPAVNAAVGSTGPPPGHVLDQYLQGGKIKCATCHDQHSNAAGSPYLRVNNDEGAMCRVCHVDHIGHTPAGPWQPDCEDCHTMHDLTSENLSLVSLWVRNETLGLDLPVVFTARTGQNSFSDGGSPSANDGICQVCHTTTAYHRYDSGGGHHAGQDCTGCHPHEAGFMPAGGGCTDCHAVAQDNGDGIPVGGRRAIVGEFPSNDAHAHYGAVLDDGACVVCHDQTTHLDGYVDLLDPDGGAAFRFVRAADLASGGRDLSVFCSNCHDADGAAALAVPADPFGNGNAPPDVASRFQGTLQWTEWYGDFCFGEEGTSRQVNSHHDIGETDQAWSGARIECLSCHGAHLSGASQPTADPFHLQAAWTGSRNAFCLECHAGGLGPGEPAFPPGVDGPTIPLRGIDSCDYQEQWWYVDYTWTHSMHGPNSKRGWAGYSGAPAYDMECRDCHDPHGSYTPSNPAGNPYMIKDVVDGTPFIDDGVEGAANGPPFEVHGTSRAVAVTINGTTVGWGGPTGLCDACHADWLNASFFHGSCEGCQSCHNHGMLWGNYDWGTTQGDEDTPCPTPLTSPAGAPLRDASVGGDDSDLPLHGYDRNRP